MCGSHKQYQFIIVPNIIFNPTITVKYVRFKATICFIGGHYTTKVFDFDLRDIREKSLLDNLSFILPEDNFKLISHIKILCDFYEEYDLRDGVIYDFSVRTFFLDYKFNLGSFSSSILYLTADIDTNIFSYEDIPAKKKLAGSTVINGYLTLFDDSAPVWFISHMDPALQNMLTSIRDDKALIKEIFGELPAEVQRSLIYIHHEIGVD